MYHLVTVPVTDDREFVAAVLWSEGAAGIEERHNQLIAAFSDETAAATVALRFATTVESVDGQSGLNSWRGHAQRQNAGPFCVRPPWLQPDDGIDLVIDPGPSFGSGSHPSTRLALNLLAEHIAPRQRVLDFGCGSGILAIGAAHLGATTVAVDTEPQALLAAESNALSNQLSDKVELRLGSATEARGTYDLILANLTIDIHEMIADQLAAEVVAPKMIVAGILVGAQEERCVSVHRRRVVQRVVEGEWAALLLGAIGSAA